MNQALGRFHGTKRRFQLISDDFDIKIIDDYAHHPTEIRATLEAARASHLGRVIAVFQPHRYTRTQFLAKDFAKALEMADDIFLMDIYPAGEDAIEGVSSQLIASYLENKSVSFLNDNISNVAEILQKNDMIIFMGAGNIWKEGPKLAEYLKKVKK